ncbi:transcriptional adapter ADA2a-like isoform X2 [Prosopis cineraria]|uniref:transcriptional adapter ADA2a-like isoform X2 n=1 Tax=Prosopis cineraria TaxID=364024 RepID=UPI00240F8331|nr:transcriptional adapter ADA2a-like isoform X2 [Prosopis cineraria]
MGRSRVASRQPDDDPNQRSKRKKAALNAENLETLSIGHGISEGKVSLYHCNYCDKDISGKIRIKCAVCQDFDLCVECFSVGAEVTPHKSNHLYRVMGIGMYGFGNWAEVAGCVGTKSKSECIDHYNAFYMNSPCFPLPDLSRVMGKSREELLAMVKECGDVKKELSPNAELTLKEEPHFSAGINSEESKKEEPTNQTLCGLTSGADMGSVPAKAYSSSNKKASNTNQINNRLKMEVESQVDRRIGEKKPKLYGDDGPSVIELSGYNFKREEFEIEYDNDAEQVLADMEFKDTDTEAERSLKLQVLHIYLKRLDERKRRKNFILERNLLYADPFEKPLTPEELQMCQRYRVFARFHSKEEHKEFLRSIIEEHRIVKRIQDLQEARAAGCCLSADAYRFIDLKRTKEAEQSAFKETAKNTLAATQEFSGSLDDWDVSGIMGVELLSESEKELCNEIRILPSHYLNMLQIMTLEISKGSMTKKSDAYILFNVEPSKVDRVYDMLVKKGIAPT